MWTDIVATPLFTFYLHFYLYYIAWITLQYFEL